MRICDKATLSYRCCLSHLAEEVDWTRSVLSLDSLTSSTLISRRRNFHSLLIGISAARGAESCSGLSVLAALIRLHRRSCDPAKLDFARRRSLVLHMFQEERACHRTRMVLFVRTESAQVKIWWLKL